MSTEAAADIRTYHRRTKHAPQRYALGPAFLDWDSQPDPFRRFEGARRVALPLCPDAPTPPFAALGEAMPPAALGPQALGLFLELALGLSAWKQAGEARWALRNNPSSGNLHPTEGWVVLPPLPGLGEAAALYHYAPHDHALEERCRFQRPPTLPAGGFLVALSSIPWREAWKYGERAFRYCQHDVGHALAALSYAGACLGWRVRALAAPGDDAVAALLGLDRPDAHHPFEAEHPDLVAMVTPAAAAEIALDRPPGEWSGTANRLGEDHERWPVIDAALKLAAKPETAPLPPPPAAAPPAPGSGEPAATIIRRRRSAQRMDNRTAMALPAFLRLLAATRPDAARPPFAALPWPTRLALALFVHRVEGLEPGLYALIRDGDSLPRLRQAMSPRFRWQLAVPESGLPLYLLEPGDLRATASGLSCQQAIAGHSAFSLGMVADFARTLAEEGDWAYRRLFWEAGAIGQALYLEATAAGLSGTGIGCYFDDSVHQLLGIDGDALDWQSLYHFTVGGAIEDTRLDTLPPYAHRPTSPPA
ncbi:SagB/ThcOx family dehydrogenase [Magnetospirillum sp. UT-4]|uniref:SagB/ThcOx family dehydrogenase n=1 Tax=Magnetospirillum sp. UT-4 TaxID=2681467 RepID=UPI00137DD70A|nr:SagB/ThcOx family dehydrogenase [Magnetospirillum sp. UT-4]CAA7611955.1 Nitroreductase [Magnetospirillum sp. UT-4]